ncbi:MAG TPA: mercury resistance system transport protein MerF [Gammaproteobacteria bacterium]|nr:mercury resistance system transport protein MerF [Gammaproteobacteria bacterium]
MSSLHDKRMKKGFIGTIVAALCCFTPVLVFLLGGVGLSAWLGWIDYLLFPWMFASLGFLAHALYLKSGKKGVTPQTIIVIAVIGVTALLFWLEFRFAIRISIAAAASVAAYAYYLRRGAVKQVA